MRNTEENGDKLGSALRAEVDSILLDPLFVRAPVQSKLLVFLCEQAIEGDKDLTQYAIAVDGLGKSENYDLQNDSYPRVQVSRLRSNLANYYSRNEPVGEHCAYIRQGDYRLRLGSRKHAYPSKVGHHEVAEPAKAVPAQDHVPAQEAKPAEQEPGSARRSGALAFTGGALALVAFVAIIGARQSQNFGSYEAPNVALELVESPDFAAVTKDASLAGRVARSSESQLSDSFVSDLASDNSIATDYKIEINLGPEIAGASAEITMFDDNADVLYKNSIPFDGNAERFERDIISNLVSLTAPNGIIAKREAQQIDGEPRSAYQCFIGVETDRAETATNLLRVESCIEQFPESNYAAFWYSRRAFHRYQADIVAGIPIERDTEAWADIVKALQIDNRNAFANFIAAKVAVTERDCERASTFAERALKRGTSYPALLAAAEIIGSGCPIDNRGTGLNQRETIASLIRNNPAPDALLHTYLMVAALSIEDRELAEDAAALLALQDSSEAVQQASSMLSRAIVDPAYFRENRQEIERLVSVFVWADAARGRISGQLGRG